MRKKGFFVFVLLLEVKSQREQSETGIFFTIPQYNDKNMMVMVI